jgi:large subunit ribosomal protein L13e
MTGVAAQMAKVTKQEARGIGISVDYRRRNKCNESLQLNVQRLKTYKARLVVFPTKKGQEWSEDMKSAVQLETPNVLKITQKKDKLEVRAITEEEKEFRPSAKVRAVRMNKRQVGPRFVKERAAAEEAAKKKK